MTRGAILGAALACEQGAREGATQANLMPTTTYDALVIADGAQAYWKLDEPSGASSFVDSTANGLHLTVNNPTGADAYQIPGLPSQGLASAIDGSPATTGVWGSSTSATFQFTIGQSFSLEAWFGSVGVSAANQSLIGRGYVTAGQDSQPWYMIGLGNNGLGYAWLRAAGIDYRLESFGRLDDANYTSRGPWHHVVATFDNVALTLKLYVDGALVRGTSAPNGGWGTNGGPFAIARHNGVSSGMWMTCHAVYLRALTPAEVANHYDTGRAGATWYPFQQSTDYGNITSALSTVQTVLNRIVPPIISSLHISTTHHLTGVGTLSLTGRGVVVSFDFVPLGWGYQLGLINVFENRLVQLEFANLLGDGVTEVPSAQYEQYENIRVYLFSDNVPLTLNYYVAPGAGIIVQQITN